METQELIEAVTKEVWRRLQHTEETDGVACGGDWQNYRRYTPDMQAAQEKRAIIVRLEPWSMVRLTQGDAASDEDRFLLEMLLLGHDVTLAPQALTYRRYQDSAPSALYQRYVEAEKKLYALGVRHWQAERTTTARLLTADAVRQIIDGGETLLTVDDDTIITPLAVDLLKAAHVSIMRRAKEDVLWNWQK